MRHVLWNSRRQAFVPYFFSRQINNDFSTFCSYCSLAELKCIRSRNEEDRSYAQDLAKSQRYSLQLERQLRELLQSPQGSGQLLNRFFFTKRVAKLLSCDGDVLSEHLQAFLQTCSQVELLSAQRDSERDHTRPENQANDFEKVWLFLLKPLNAIALCINIHILVSGFRSISFCSGEENL